MYNEFKVKRIPLFQILTIALRLLRDNFKVILPFVLLIFVPVNVIISLISVDLDITAKEVHWQSIWAMAIVSIGILPLVTAAMTHLVRCSVEGKPLTYDEMMTASFGNWARILTVSILYYMFVIIGAIIIIPAIFYGIVYYFAIFLVVATEKSGFGALRESATIVKGRFWYIFSMVLRIGILKICFNMVIIYLIQLPLLSMVGDINGTNASAAYGISLVTSVLSDTFCVVFDIACALFFYNMLFTKQEQ